MLRVAVPNKGSLSEAATQLLKEAGYIQRRDSRELVIADTENEVEFFYLRPRDIAVYVGKGTLDVGITGRDLLQDSQAPAQEVMGLDFARSTFHFAGPQGQFTSIDELQGKRIATSYANLVSDYLQERHIDASVIRLDGAIESSIRLGVADAIADVVETGNTMRAAGLEPFGEALMSSEALLIKRHDAHDLAGLEKLHRRLRGVLIARQYVLVDYDIEQESLPQATEITPGLEAPTISPLNREGWVAVRSMVSRKSANNIMDQLYAAGARAILVSPIQAARL